MDVADDSAVLRESDMAAMTVAWKESWKVGKKASRWEYVTAASMVYKMEYWKVVESGYGRVIKMVDY